MIAIYNYLLADIYIILCISNKFSRITNFCIAIEISLNSNIDNLYQ